MVNFLSILLVTAVCVSGSPVKDSWVVRHRVARETEPEDFSSNESWSQPQKEKVAEPILAFMKVESQIRLRYATTKVTSRVLNPTSMSQEVRFHIVLPETARINGTEYVAEVKEKEKAQKEYDAAVSAGQTAAQVANNNVRDANQFTVSVNVGAAEKVEFELVYEELLVRRLGRYEHAIYVNPGRVVEDLQVQVKINESLPVKVNVVDLRNDIHPDPEENVKQLGEVIQISEKEAEVNFRPSVKEQKEFSKSGIQGQFVVQYEVDYSSQEKKGGEIQIVDGYFVHFFAPSNLPVLPKHVVFVLDTSGSMLGEKLNQTKQAMNAILDQLTPQDYFSIIEFNFEAKEWDLRKATRPTFRDPWRMKHSTESENSTTTEAPLEPTLGSYDHLNVYPTNAKAISKAKRFVDLMEADGGTNINDALMLALKNVQSLYGKIKSNPAPIIVFLTDGEATSGETNLETILSNTAKANSDGVVSIFSLAFGRGADFKFLKKVSLENKGFARKIYEASDAAMQLKGFFSEIASPLLSDVTFTYVGEVENVTETVIPKFFAGSECIIAGKVEDWLTVLVNATSADGDYYILTNQTTTTSEPSRFVERLWAYLTIKELIKKSEGNDNSTASLKERALELSMKYKFVTPLTSLLVVKPDGNSVEELKPADDNDVPFDFHMPHSASMSLGLPGMPGLPGLPPLPRPTMNSMNQPEILMAYDSDFDDIPATIDYSKIPLWLTHLSYNETHITVSKNSEESTLLWGFEDTKTYEVCSPPSGNSTAVTCKSPWECSSTYSFKEDDICVIENTYIGICCK